MIKMITLSISFLLAFASNAFAHHPLGGVVPETMLNGLLSGLGHPVIGFVQLALMFGAGFVTGQIWKAASIVELQPRLAGALLAGVGLTYLAEHGESYMMAGM